MSAHNVRCDLGSFVDSECPPDLIKRRLEFTLVLKIVELNMKAGGKIKTFPPAFFIEVPIHIELNSAKRPPPSFLKP